MTRMRVMPMANVAVVNSWTSTRTALRLTVVLLAAILLTFAVLTSSALADPPEGLDPALGNSAVLRYQFTEGASHRYLVELEQTVQMEGAAIGLEAAGELATTTVLSMQLNTTQLVTGVEEGGNGNLSLSIDGTVISISINDQNLPADEIASQLNGMQVNLTMTTRGEVTESALEEVDDPQISMMLSSVEDSLGQMSILFPDGEVTVGQSWTDSVPLELDQQGMDVETTTTANYTFLGFAPIQGITCAVIQTEVTVEMTGSFEEMGIETTTAGTGTGIGYSYFDNAAGVLVQGEMDMTMNATIVAEGMDVTQQISMNVDVIRQ